MLVVQVEIWPFGSQRNKRTLAAVAIGNDGTGTTERGNYDASLKDGKDRIFQCRVEGFDREQDALVLLYEVLKQYVGDQSVDGGMAPCQGVGTGSNPVGRSNIVKEV